MIGKKKLLVIILVIVVGIYLERRSRKIEGATIEIKNGKLKGSISESRDGRSFYEFLGIPFAEPPVGELRFEPPRPYKKTWTEVYDASYFREACLQLSLLTALTRGDEDCLYLNVYTPKLNPKKGQSLPVLVFFYGGLFMEGQSNMYGGKYFMDQDVVLVTLNYRIGALGFLNTNDGEILGNMGLKDQNMALQWVQANIKAFGGNPQKVTIFGQSAGSAAVHYHLLSKKSKGLFQKAISQSGVALNPWAFNPNPGGQAKRYAGQLNCPTNDSKAMKECLKSRPGYDLIAVHREVLDATRNPITIFVPTLEVVDNDEAFLTKNPFDIIKSGDGVLVPNKVPWLTGVVPDEGLIASLLLLRNETLWNMDATTWTQLAPNSLYYEPNLEITEKIRHHYLPGISDDAPRNEILFKNLTDLFTDRHFHKGIHDAAVHYSKFAPVYLYYFSHPTQFSLGDILMSVKGVFPAIVEIVLSLTWGWFKKNLFGIQPTRYGICHADEVHLLFNVGPHDAVGVGHIDYHISQNLVKLWVDFANDHSNLKFMGTPWPQQKIQNSSNRSTSPPASLSYMELGLHGKLVDPPNIDRFEFWNALNLSNG